MGGTPGFKGYKGFPYAICSSRNDEIVHGFPSDKALEDGEIISIDFGVLYKKWYGDSAFTKAVGYVSPEIENLIKVGEECLYKGITQAKPYMRIGDISAAIQRHAEKNGYNVIRDFVGHGVGKELHEDPQVPNFGKRHEGYLIKPGMVIAIEPMITPGTGKAATLNDGWTTVSADHKLSVHFEHTIAITSNGTEILTKRKR